MTLPASANGNTLISDEDARAFDVDSDKNLVWEVNATTGHTTNPTGHVQRLSDDNTLLVFEARSTVIAPKNSKNSGGSHTF